jgi:uncharacterized protein YceH (UPF0502 family)
MRTELTPHEARIIGCLIEKQITTPDQYPLSLNALTSACNQKSNRDPVIELSEREIQELVDALARKHLLLEKSGFGSRVPKYQQRFCNMEFSALKFTPQETAIICELLLRGAQTPGELRGRASRMAALRDVTEVEALLQNLAQRQPEALVAALGREPGKREIRYAHLFCGPIAEATLTPAAISPAGAEAVSREDRLSLVEEQLRQLRAEVEQLKRSLERG